MNAGLRLSLIPSAACAEPFNCPLYVVLPQRVTVPSEFTKYSLIAENLADAVTDCTSGYCLNKLVKSSSVFFHADRKSTRPELQSRLHLVCRLLLEKKKYIVIRPVALCTHSIITPRVTPY